jgi:hypothetical protein
LHACPVRPHLVRLATWARLERVPAGDLVTTMTEETERKPTAIAEARTAGRLDAAYAPEDVLAVVSTMALTWSPASLFHAAASADPEADRERRRRALAEAVRRALAEAVRRAFSPPA